MGNESSNIIPFKNGKADSVYIPPAPAYNNRRDEEGGSNMDTAKLIERLDQDRRDSELRLQNSMDSLKRELREDRQQTEQRLDDRMAEERRLSEQREERMEKRFSESMARFDKTTGELKNDVNHLKWWILGVCMATIIGIASMIITVILN